MKENRNGGKGQAERWGQKNEEEQDALLSFLLIIV